MCLFQCGWCTKTDLLPGDATDEFFKVEIVPQMECQSCHRVGEPESGNRTSGTITGRMASGGRVSPNIQSFPNIPGQRRMNMIGTPQGRNHYEEVMRGMNGQEYRREIEGTWVGDDESSFVFPQIVRTHRLEGAELIAYEADRPIGRFVAFGIRERSSGRGSGQPDRVRHTTDSFVATDALRNRQEVAAIIEGDNGAFYAPIHQMDVSITRESPNTYPEVKYEIIVRSMARRMTTQIEVRGHAVMRPDRIVPLSETPPPEPPSHANCRSTHIPIMERGEVRLGGEGIEMPDSGTIEINGEQHRIVPGSLRIETHPNHAVETTVQVERPIENSAPYVSSLEADRMARQARLGASFGMGAHRIAAQRNIAQQAREASKEITEALGGMRETATNAAIAIQGVESSMRDAASHIADSMIGGIIGRALGEHVDQIIADDLGARTSDHSIDALHYASESFRPLKQRPGSTYSPIRFTEPSATIRIRKA